LDVSFVLPAIPKTDHRKPLFAFSLWATMATGCNPNSFASACAHLRNARPYLAHRLPNDRPTCRSVVPALGEGGAADTSVPFSRLSGKMKLLQAFAKSWDQ
jgi:hypothetical protein